MYANTATVSIQLVYLTCSKFMPGSDYELGINYLENLVLIRPIRISHVIIEDFEHMRRMVKPDRK